MIGALKAQTKEYVYSLFIKPEDRAQENIALTPQEEAVYSSLEKVCVPLGPYRNLTTLMASIYALHPESVVLNHAAMRIMEGPAHFLAKLSPQRLDVFKKNAVRMLQSGSIGDYGGNVLYSHAFHRDLLKNTYKDRYGGDVLKPGAKCLFWKESMRIENEIRKRNLDIKEILETYPELVFIRPIRDPIDCAASSLRTGHTRHLAFFKQNDFETILVKILESLQWFRSCERQYPERFFSFTSDDVNESFLKKLAAFSGISADEKWIEDVMAIYTIYERREHNKERSAMYHKYVDALFADDPEMLAKLKSFVS